MKTKIQSFLGVCWYVLTEVPGWPDAPWTARTARAAPIALPVALVTALIVWQVGYYAPRIQDVHTRLTPLVELERQVSTLQIANSEKQVTQMAERTAAANRLLLDSPKELPTLLENLKSDLLVQGWATTFQIVDTSEDTLPAGSQIAFLPVRARLRLAAGNSDPFTSFLAVLERLSSSNKRIDLTRIAIRADDTRWQTVEATLRLACPAPNAKTP